MPEPRRKTFFGHFVRRTGIVLLTILPYLLVSTVGALAVAVVAKTSTHTINAKFGALIQALKRH